MGIFLQKEMSSMKTTIKYAFRGALACGLLVLSLPFVSALEYHYDAGLYDDHFYTPTCLLYTSRCV